MTDTRLSSMSASNSPAMPSTATRHIGFCGFCERDIRLELPSGNAPHIPLLVHHGYQRPGDGRIHGDCMGVHQPPYEITAEPLRTRRDGLATDLPRLIAAEIQWRTNPPHAFDVTQNAWPYGVELNSYAIGVSPESIWNEKVAHRHADAAQALDLRRREIDRLTKLVLAWTPKPIRTLDELVKKKAERAAATAAKRVERAAEKQAQRATIDTKKAARDAALQARIDKFKVDAHALATELIEAPQRRSTMDRQIARMQARFYALRKKLPFAPLTTFSPETTLVILRLAYADKTGVHAY